MRAAPCRSHRAPCAEARLRASSRTHMNARRHPPLAARLRRHELALWYRRAPIPLHMPPPLPRRQFGTPASAARVAESVRGYLPNRPCMYACMHARQPGRIPACMHMQPGPHVAPIPSASSARVHLDIRNRHVALCVVGSWVEVLHRQPPPDERLCARRLDHLARPHGARHDEAQGVLPDVRHGGRGQRVVANGNRADAHLQTQGVCACGVGGWGRP